MIHFIYFLLKIIFYKLKHVSTSNQHIDILIKVLNFDRIEELHGILRLCNHD